MPTTELNSHQVTLLLEKWQQGDVHAHEQILQSVYYELKNIARSHLARQHGACNTLQPTVLVHEAYLKLNAGNAIGWQNRQHYLAICAHAMRQILVDYSRKKNAQKRAGKQLTLTINIDSNQPHIVDALVMDETLQLLEQLQPIQATIVELRFFGGLSIAEIASVLDTSESTVNRHWRTARAWLNTVLSNEQAS